MVEQTAAMREVTILSEREQEIARLELLRQHKRHQHRVGTITKLGRQELSHADYAKKHAHRLSRPWPVRVSPDEPVQERGSARWVQELQAFDFRAYQSKLMGVDLRDAATYAWWMSLGDKQRYSAIREGAKAMRDEHEQEKRTQRRERLKKMREAGEI